MLKSIYEVLALAYEVIIDFIKYLRKSWKSIFFFLIISIGLFLFVVCVLNIDCKNIASDIIAGFISIPIVIFVIRFFYTYSREERKRLMDAGKCVDFYKNSHLNFIEYKGKKYPSIIFYKPDRRISLKDIKVETHPELYKLPDKIHFLYEPIEDQIRKRFLDAGHFNSPKARMIDFRCSVDRITARIQQTFYYYTFITNFFADYPLYNNKVTLRQVYKDEFIENIKHLNKEMTSNHLGFGGFVISRDGKIPLFLRKSSTAVNSHMLGNTFNGSVDWYGTESIHKSVLIELKEETGINVKEEDVFLMGIERNILWLGKTDMHMLTLGNEDFQELKRKIIKSKTKEENLICVMLDLGVAVKSIDDLEQNRDNILKKLDSELEALRKKYQLSLPLLTGLYLLESFIGDKSLYCLHSERNNYFPER